MNIVVADSRRHAEAVIAWMKLDAEDWVAYAYGETLKGVYSFAKLVRPLSGITEAHYDWILEQLIPRVIHDTHPVPMDWKFNSPEPVHDQIQTGLAQNPIWGY